MAKTTKTASKSTTSAKASTAGVATATKPAKATAEKVTAKATTTTCSAPSYEQISQRAYEIWVAKGYPQGQDLQNWQQAEAELTKGSLVTA